MYPILDLGSCILSLWYLCFITGICVCLYFYKKILQDFKFKPIKKALILFLILYLSGFIGARLTSFITEQNGSFSNIKDLFSLGPLTLYGSLFLAVPIGIYYSKKNKLDSLTLSDSASICILLGLFFGRAGCFFNGCDYGKIIDISYLEWMGVDFSKVGIEGNRYPTQLIESIFSLLGFLIIYKYRFSLRKINSGIITGIVCISYGVERFFNELLRDDPRSWIIKESLSFSQFISILLICFGIIFIYYRFSLCNKTESMS